MSAIQRVLRNGLAALVQKALRLSEHLLLIPLFLHAWGSEYYGAWLTLMAIPAAMSFVDLGFGSAAATAMVHALAQGLNIEFRAAFASGIWAIHAVIGVISIASAALLVSGDRLNWWQFDGLGGNAQASIAILLMIGSRLVAFYQQLFEGLFVARRLAHVGMNLHALHALVNLLMTAGCLVLGANALELAAATFGWSMLFTAAYCVIAYKMTDFDGLIRGWPSKNGMAKLLQSGLGYMLSPLWQIIIFQGATIVVSVSLGAVAVAQFNTARTLTRTITQVYSLFVSASISELQVEIGAGDLTRATRILRATVGASVLVGALGALVLSAWGSDLYTLWVNRGLEAQPALVRVLLVGVVASALWWPASHVFLAANRPFEFAALGAGVAVFAVVLAYLLGSRLGLIGIACGSVAFDLILAVLILPAACKMLRLRLADFLLGMLFDGRALMRSVSAKVLNAVFRVK